MKKQIEINNKNDLDIAMNMIVVGTAKIVTRAAILNPEIAKMLDEKAQELILLFSKIAESEEYDEKVSNDTMLELMKLLY